MTVAESKRRHPLPGCKDAAVKRLWPCKWRLFHRRRRYNTPVNQKTPLKTAGIRELRALFTTYKLNKKTMTQFKCRIHSIFTENGVDILKKQVANPENRTKLLGLPLTDTWKQQLKMLYIQLDTIEQETEQIKKLIYELGYRLFREEIEILLSIHGFSSIYAGKLCVL